MQEEIRSLVDNIAEVVDCKRIYLFGSYAKGKQRDDSDIDLYIVVPDGSPRPFDIALTIRKHLSNVSKPAPIDIVVKHFSAFSARSVLPTMENQVIEEGVLMYEKL